MHLPANTILNNKQYRIKKVIGQGGFGITYLAEEIGYYRQTGYSEKPEYVEAKVPDVVVIKELYYDDYCQRDLKTGLVNISNTEKRVEFSKLVENQLDEGKKLRSLNHPNIVRTRDIFKENDTAYMVMDYVESTDLEELLNKAGKLEKPKALQYITQVLSALTHIHDRNKLHLDIKPSNVLIKNNSDEAIVIDFGASQSYDESGKIIGKTSQLVAGMTKHYAPNEQADLDNLKHFDATFDTYAAGATLYHLLTGQKPPLSSLLSTGRERLIPPSTFVNNNGVSDYLDAVLAKSLAPMFHERFKSAAEFEGALEKETEYIKRVSEIGKLIASKNFQLAVSKIETTETSYLPTKTLADYKKIANTELNKDRLKIDFQKHFSKGLEWQNSKDYSNAIHEFEKALELQPDNAEAKTNLNHCTLQLAEINKLKEIDNLLKECKTLISNNQYEQAKKAINKVFAIKANHVEAISLLTDIKNKEEEISAKALTELITAFNNEDYQKATGFIQSINIQTLSKKDLPVINLLTAENVLQYTNVADDLNTINTDLNKLNSNANDFDRKLQNLDNDYIDLSQKINKLYLPHTKLNALKVAIGKTLKTKQESTIVITSSKKTTNEEAVVNPLDQEQIPPKKNKEKYIYRGILLAIIAAVALLYIKEKSSKVIDEIPIAESKDLLPASTLDTALTTILPSKSKDTGTSLVATPKENALKVYDKWKVEFKNRFNEIKAMENNDEDFTYEDILTKYQALYNWVPESANTERGLLKLKIDTYKSKINTHKTEVNNIQLESRATDLDREGDRLFSLGNMKNYDLAFQKYISANALIKGIPLTNLTASIPENGYQKFLNLALALKKENGGCDDIILKLFKYAQRIKNTTTINNLISGCGNKN